MDLTCPRCHESNRSEARFCAHCGLLLESADGGPLGPGSVRHPDPLPVPEGFEPCDDTVNLHFRWESAWGGTRLLGTEGMAVALFNGGYPLQTVVLAIRGADKTGRELFALEHPVDEAPRGREVSIEVPSYELPGPVHKVRVSLVSAEFGTDA